MPDTLEFSSFTEAQRQEIVENFRAQLHAALGLEPEEVQVEQGVSLIHQAFTQQDIQSITPEEPRAVVRFPDTTETSTERPQELYERLYGQLLGDTHDVGLARRAALESFATIMNLTNEDAERQIGQWLPPDAPPRQQYFVQGPANLTVDYNASPWRTIDPEPHPRRWSVGFEQLTVNPADWTAEGNRPFYDGPDPSQPTNRLYIDKSKESQAVNDMTKQDFKTLVEVVDDATRNLADLFNEHVANQVGRKQIEPLSSDQVRTVLANQIADRLDGKYNFDREKFLAACGIKE